LQVARQKLVADTRAAEGVTIAVILLVNVPFNPGLFARREDVRSVEHPLAQRLELGRSALRSVGQVLGVDHRAAPLVLANVGRRIGSSGMNPGQIQLRI